MTDRSDVEDRVGPRRRHSSLKWSAVERGVVPAWLAEHDFGLPPSVERGLPIFARQSAAGYADMKAVQNGAIESFTQWYQKNYSWYGDIQLVSACPGIVFGVGVALRALTGPRSAIIVATPVHRPLYDTILYSRRIPIDWRLERNGDGWRHNFDTLHELLASSDNVAAVLLSNPQNPTGTTLTSSEVDLLREIASTHSVRLIVDEALADLAHGTIPFTPAVASDKCDAIAFYSPVKAFSLGDVRSAFAMFSSDHLAAAFRREIKALSASPDRFSLEVSIAALNTPPEWIHEVAARVVANWSTIAATLRRANIDSGFYIPDGGLTGAFPLPAAMLDIANVEEHVLRKCRIALRGPSRFGGDHHDFVRIAVGLTTYWAEILADRMLCLFAR